MATVEEDQPKTQSYANALYAAFDSTANDRVVAGKVYRIWEGSLIETCHSVGIPRGVERRVTKLLESIDCIELLQRGSKGYPSIMALLQAPTGDLWAKSRDIRLTERPTAARLAVDVRSIKQSLGGVDLGEVLKNHEERISGIESILRGKGLM